MSYDDPEMMELERTGSVTISSEKFEAIQVELHFLRVVYHHHLDAKMREDIEDAYGCAVPPIPKPGRRS